MIGIVVVAHGHLAEVLVETTAMIMGPQEHLHGVPFASRDSLETLRSHTCEHIAAYPDGCLILTDIIGGSATNVCVDFLSKPSVRIITGVNLPMLLDAVAHRSRLALDELARRVSASGSKAIVDVKELMEKRSTKKSS